MCVSYRIFTIYIDFLHLVLKFALQKHRSIDLTYPFVF